MSDTLILKSERLNSFSKVGSSCFAESEVYDVSPQCIVRTPLDVSLVRSMSKLIWCSTHQYLSYGREIMYITSSSCDI